MTDYALLVHLGDGEAPIRVPLPPCTPDEAEVERQALVSRVEAAVEIDAPEINARDTAPGNDIAIDPHLVTGVDLIDVAEQ